MWLNLVIRAGGLILVKDLLDLKFRLGGFIPTGESWATDFDLPDWDVFTGEMIGCLVKFEGIDPRCAHRAGSGQC
jgi:hypothetical protein